MRSYRLSRARYDRFTEAAKPYFNVDDSMVIARLKGALFPLLFAKITVMHGLRVHPDLYCGLWLPLLTAVLTATGHPFATALPMYFYTVVVGLVLCWSYLVVSASVLFLIQRTLLLRPQFLSLLSMCSYCLAPWCMGCGLLYHRHLPDLPDCPVSTQDIIIIICCGSSSLWLVLGSMHSALGERPDLTQYRSRAMAVLRLEASQRATPLPLLKAAAQHRVRNSVSVRGIVLGAVFSLTVLTLQAPFTLLFREHLNGEWGGTWDAIDRLYIHPAQDSPSPPPPPAFAHVDDVAELHSKYLEEVNRLKEELVALHNTSSTLRQTNLLQQQQIMNITDITSLQAQLGRETRMKELSAIKGSLGLVMNQLSALKNSSASAAGSAGPPPMRRQDLAEAREEALTRAAELQDALLWAARRKAEKRRAEGAKEPEIVKLEREVEMLRREKKEMETEAKIRSMQRDAGQGVMPKPEPVNMPRPTNRRPAPSRSGSSSARARTSLSSSQPQKADPEPKTLVNVRHNSAGKSSIGNSHTSFQASVASTTATITPKQQRTADLLRRLGKAVAGH